MKTKLLISSIFATVLIGSVIFSYFTYYKYFKMFFWLSNALNLLLLINFGYILFRIFSAKIDIRDSLMSLIITLVTITCLCSIAVISVNKNKKMRYETTDIKVLCPYGIPALFFYSQLENKNIFIQRDVSLISREFAAENYDIIVFDLLTGLKNIVSNEKSVYKLMFTLTTSQLYLVNPQMSEKDDTNFEDLSLSRKKILAFGADGSSPRKIFEKVLFSFFPKLPKENIDYKNNLTEIVKVLKNDMKTQKFTYDFYLISEPILSEIKATSKVNFKCYDIHTLWHTKITNEDYQVCPLQAAVFINLKSISFSQINLDTFNKFFADFAQNIKPFDDNKSRNEVFKKNKDAIKRVLGINTDNISDMKISARVYLDTEMINAVSTFLFLIDRELLAKFGLKHCAT
ncbi:MAG: hypothetical protein J6Y70_00330 [Bacilli bacterium]|nr:hypothetical protein [Bacilli bacterium]